MWVFRDAPKQYRDLSDNGGDEDYVALIPAGVDTGQSALFNFLSDSGSWFGCCCIDEHTLENGDTVYIGSHA